MILFGAGLSVPFGIPGMQGFTQKFIEENMDINDFLQLLNDAVNKTEETVGISLTFDLEVLLSILNDLSGRREKAISMPTASLLMSHRLTLYEARKEYGPQALITLQKLQSFIFTTCLKPTKEVNDYNLLNLFYGPLITVLNRAELGNIQPSVNKVFTTNWDICFKTWADYSSIPLHDGTALDNQSLPVLNIEEFNKQCNGFMYIPLHGSLDTVKIRRSRGLSTFEDILKISDPVRYFEGKPENIRDLFIIYPLEAIGYEESVKSPYLEMLSNFRMNLMNSQDIFIVGYSMRDPTIGSILEEVVAEKVRQGFLTPMSEELDSRRRECGVHRFRIIVINPEPEVIAKNLRKLGNSNILSTFIPIKTTFPSVKDDDFKGKYGIELHKLIRALLDIRYLDPNQVRLIVSIIDQRYGIQINLKQALT